MSSKGFLIFAQGIEYLRQAYALALSIKLSQPVYNSVTVVTNNTMPLQYKSVFDHIVEIPWQDESKDSEWKIENRWKMIYASPYDETIVLDSDMLFFKDITPVWTVLENYDLFFANNVIDYKGRVIVDNKNRQSFIENKLPNVYFALHYFKKTQKSFDFYKMLEFVVHNWQECYSKYAPLEYQNWLSIDVSAAIALKILDLDSESTSNSINFNFVHMKPNIQGWRPVPEKWTSSCTYYITKDLDFFINQFKQKEIFHYVENEFLTDDLINLLELKYGE